MLLSYLFLPARGGMGQGFFYPQYVLHTEQVQPYFIVKIMTTFSKFYDTCYHDWPELTKGSRIFIYKAPIKLKYLKGLVIEVIFH